MCQVGVGTPGAPAVEPWSPGGRALNGPTLQKRKLRPRSQEARASGAADPGSSHHSLLPWDRGVRPHSLRPRRTAHKERNVPAGGVLGGVPTGGERYSPSEHRLEVPPRRKGWGLREGLGSVTEGVNVPIWFRFGE